MFLIVDGQDVVQGYRGDQQAIVKADAKHWQVGAASIVAKVSRDQDMIEMAKQYPAYGWESNKGYGTKSHRKQILLTGSSPYHRQSFLKKIVRAVQRDEAKEAAEHVKVCRRHWG
jgi:ribonuclease HII